MTITMIATTIAIAMTVFAVTTIAMTMIATTAMTTTAIAAAGLEIVTGMPRPRIPGTGSHRQLRYG